MLRQMLILGFAAAACIAIAGCSGEREGRSLDGPADEWVRLALAIGRHDANYVDAYYGPPEWKDEADSGDPVPLDELRRRARKLLETVRQAEPSDRREFLEKELIAADAHMGRLSGEVTTLTEEARLVYDIVPAVHPVEEFAAARENLEALVPGEGDLPARIQALREQFTIPKDRLHDVVRAALEICRKKTVEMVELPDTETFRVSFVTQKPWGAYNWYEGNLHSLIEVNTDLPIALPGFFETLSHEGYPGHHTYNVLLEDRLVRGRGWREFAVSPLFSPQGVISEGTAEAGVSVIMTEDERWTFIRETLAPLAGFEDRDFETYRAVRKAMRPLKYVRGEAARMLLDEGRNEDEVVEFLVRYGLLSQDRARKAVDFARVYRAYVFNYSVGEDLVEAYLGDGPDRAERYFDILERPVTPSSLRAAAD